MRINKISLQNFRCFKSLEVTFDAHVTILVAPNGAGKTTVLDAIRFALYPFIEGFDISGDQPAIIRTEDLRLIYRPDELNMEVASPSKILVLGKWGNPPQEKSCEVSLLQLPPAHLGELLPPSRSSQVSTHTSTLGISPPSKLKAPSWNLTQWARELQSQVRDENRTDPVQLPLVLYLGTARMWYQERYKMEAATQHLDNSAFSRLAGYDNCLSATSGYKQFEQWYSWLWRSLREFQIKKLENQATDFTESTRINRMKEAIQAIQQAINALTQEATGWFDLEYSSSHNQQLVMNHSLHGKIPLNQLSDGLRNTVAMVADIAFRCVKLNPHLRGKASLETEGIVLIDEVDMFLHPAWQQRIIQSLRAAFPRLQFIVTTHSPQVLSTVKRHSIRLLSQDEQNNGCAETPLGTTYGAPSNDVMHSVMGVDPQPPIAERVDLQTLTALVDQGGYDDPTALQLMAHLQQALGKQHPQLLRLERSIARQKMIKGKL